MTTEEAIKRLEKIKAIYQGMDNKSDVKALDMAISALQLQSIEEDTDQKSLEEWTAGEEKRWESEVEE